MQKNRNEFINPYHFISLPEKPRRSEKKSKTDSAGEETFTGKIVYEIETKTPLFFPNASCENAFISDVENHKSYDFFSYDILQAGDGDISKTGRHPVLPGSEIRGMFRSVYEAVTGSCLSAMNGKEIMHRRLSPRQAFRPGLLWKNGNRLFLIQGNTIQVPFESVSEGNTYTDGQKVKCRIVKEEGYRKYGKMDSDGKATGYLLIGENPKDSDGNYQGNKRNGAVFRPRVKTDNQKKIKSYFKIEGFDPKESLAYLNGILDAYEEDSGQYVEYRKRLNLFLDGKTKTEFFPVYYKLITFRDDSQDETKKPDQKLLLSPAAITKELYEKRVKDLIGEFAPCKSSQELCPACSLFGMVSEEKGMNHADRAKASHLRFADAQMENREDCYLEPVTLQELASPHISNAEFYLKKPSGDNIMEWNYDYYVFMDKTKNQKKLVLYDAKIRGHKFYWHQDLKNEEISGITSAEQTERNVTVRPLKAGKSFVGEIYFDSITKDQLEQIVYLANLSFDDKKGYKLGLGKPLGLGSISMKVKQVVIRELDFALDHFWKEEEMTVKEFWQWTEEEWTKKKAQPDYTDVGFVTEEGIQTQFEALMSFGNTKNHTVSYPYTKSQADDTEMKEGFNWFTKNKSGSYRKSLPNIEQGKVPVLKVIDDSQDGKKSGKGKKH